MTSNPKRLRRSQLAVPGSNERQLKKAAASDADHVFCDLEDAVAPNAKGEARKTVVHALNRHDWGKKTRCVRINDVGTPWCHDDIIEVVTGAGENLDTIMIPKATRPADVRFVDLMLTQLELKLGLTKRIGLEALIEEAEALQNCELIAASSPRLEALILGMGDYSASQGIAVSEIGNDGEYPGDLWHYPRFRMTMACRAAGIDAIDGPYANFQKPEGYVIECKRALALGMVGKWAIHPSQIAPAIEAFSPHPKEVAMARKMAAAYDEAMAQGIGSVNIDGVMVDAASIRILNNVIAKADLIGM
ncbi:MAG: HpcH/HpaI aldolase/citrate lyase family protein [Sphingorhabdus sp.]